MSLTKKNWISFFFWIPYFRVLPENTYAPHGRLRKPARNFRLVWPVSGSCFNGAEIVVSRNNRSFLWWVCTRKNLNARLSPHLAPSPFLESRVSVFFSAVWETDPQRKINLMTESRNQWLEKTCGVPVCLCKHFVLQGPNVWWLQWQTVHIRQFKHQT